MGVFHCFILTNILLKFPVEDNVIIKSHILQGNNIIFEFTFQYKEIKSSINDSVWPIKGKSPKEYHLDEREYGNIHLELRMQIKFVSV